MPTNAAPEQGEGFNRNYPMPFGTAWEEWSASLEDACRHLSAFEPRWRRRFASSREYVQEGTDQSVEARSPRTIPRSASEIAGLGLPTLFVMEGGYAVDEIGVNAVGVLTGFDG